jgi:two-component system, NarL family, nitrate/nitrite response regulator NarL
LAAEEDELARRRAPGAQPGRTADQDLIRVVVISNHLVVRAGLTMLICPEQDIDLVADAAWGSQALETVAAYAPDVVVLDPDGCDGVDFVTPLSQAAPSAKLLVFTGLRNVGRHEAILRNGARGLVLKDAPADVLLKAIRRVESGELWFQELLSSVASRRAAAADAAGPHERHIATLTDRERTLVTLIGEGLRNDQIAERMGVAEKTIRNQLSTVFDKLGVNDRLGLAVYAYQHGLARPRD